MAAGSVKRRAFDAATRLPGLSAVQRLVAQRDEARQERNQYWDALVALRKACGPYLPGHFYSPIPDFAEIRANPQRYWPTTQEGIPASLPGIDLRPAEQLALLDQLAPYAADWPFTAEPADNRRYGFHNKFFAAGDGLVLYCMLRMLRPSRVIEVGSGWSSALMLDVVETHGGTELTFIEPFPERLDRLMRADDRHRVEVIPSALRDVDVAAFGQLSGGDILFIDSSHVSRIGSDVNQLLLEIIPSLPDGVLVHVHDIFYPFEYPPNRLLRHHAWNEAYLLRAYLNDNSRAHISWFNDYLAKFHREAVATKLPGWERNTGGSIWFRTGPDTQSRTGGGKAVPDLPTGP